MKNELNNEYFEWMYKLVCNEKKYRKLSYRKLLSHLHNIEFTYILDMDSNRAEDGIDLRFRFGYEHNYTRSKIDKYLDTGPCSVLEMMVALAMRCEENIMDDPEMGDRLGQWFWYMISSLGLYSMNDSRFDKKYVDNIIATFLNREYRENGDGGLFIIKNPKYDLRKAEIWYQMCWYLDEFLSN